MKKVSKILLVFGIVIGVIILILYFSSNLFEADKNFETDSVLLKLNTGQDQIFSKSLKIKNLDEIQRDFEIRIQDLDFVSVYEKEFNLISGEEKIVNLNFNIFGQSPRVYLGVLSVVSGKEVLEIPIILEIESESILFDSNLNVPLEYSKVYPGGELVIENKLFNLENIGLSSVSVDYLLKDFKGKTIFSEEQRISFETQHLNRKIISIPSDLDIGNYVFIAKIKHGESVGTSVYFFKITDKKYEFVGNISYAWIAFVLLLIVIVFILYNVRQRDKFLLELGRQHKEQLRRESERLRSKSGGLLRLKPSKRKEKLKEFRREKKLRVRAIQGIYKERVKTVKKLKKQKKSNQIKNKISSWKKQGYNVNEFSIKRAKPKSLKKTAKDFKKEGYGM